MDSDMQPVHSAPGRVQRGLERPERALYVIGVLIVIIGVYLIGHSAGEKKAKRELEGGYQVLLDSARVQADTLRAKNDRLFCQNSELILQADKLREEVEDGQGELQHEDGRRVRDRNAVRDSGSAALKRIILWRNPRP